MKEYAIRDCMFDDCDQSGYEAVRDCYKHCSEWFEAENDEEAIKMAEQWQEIDDAEAKEILKWMEENGEDTYAVEKAILNAPCYAACIYNRETGEPVELY